MAIVHNNGKETRPWDDKLANNSILRQAVDDWTANSWIDFKWSQESECKSPYEPLQVEWLGTVRGENTADGGV